MKLSFPRMTAALFDAMFDTSRSKSDRHKATNDALDEEVDDPLRLIAVDVNDAMLEIGVRAANQIGTEGDPSLYNEERIYRAYVAMERARRVRAVAVPREERAGGEE